VPAQNANVPFARLSRKGQILGPSTAGFTFGGLWTPIMKPVGGYLRGLEFRIQSTGGNRTTATQNADAPYNVVQNLYFRDPFGQPIIQADGYSLFLVNLYSGQVGALGFGNVPAALPSFQPISTTTGNFTVRMYVPLELDSSGYCSLPDMNASSQPQLQVQTNPTSVVFSALTGGTT